MKEWRETQWGESRSRVLNNASKRDWGHQKWGRKKHDNFDNEVTKLASCEDPSFCQSTITLYADTMFGTTTPSSRQKCLLNVHLARHVVRLISGLKISMHALSLVVLNNTIQQNVDGNMSRYGKDRVPLSPARCHTPSLKKMLPPFACATTMYIQYAHKLSQDFTCHHTSL